MNHFHSRFYTKLFLIRFFHRMQNRRIDIRLPTGISTGHFYLHTRHRETTFKTGSKVFFHTVTGTASQYFNFRLAISNHNDSQIGRSFYCIGNSRNHTHHPILTSKDRIDQIVLNFFGDFSLRYIYPFGFKTDRGFDSRIFFIEQVFAILHQSQ